MSSLASLEVESSLTLLVSPLVAVLSMAIGCSIMDDAGLNDYHPIYMACRMGAVGGPIAAVFCILVSSSFVIDDDIPRVEPIEIVSLRRKLNGFKIAWGIVTPYVIGIIGAPVGSAILRAADLSDTISPLSAVRAAAIGGIFTMPVYYIFIYLLWCLVKPCLILSDDVSSFHSEPRFV